MRIAVIGAGPAGLTCAKQALGDGHDVVVYEKTDDVGGIWNPAAGGAYDAVRMQSSRMSFPFSDFSPRTDTDFPTLAEVHAYLRAYAEQFGVAAVIRLGHRVSRVVKNQGEWHVSAVAGADEAVTDRFDAVLVANGELWRPRMPAVLPDADSGVRVLSAKQYRNPDDIEGERVLVVGGGVSGADISCEVAGTAASVDWSVRNRLLFLPRRIAGAYNDALFSYIGRVGVEELPYDRYLDFLAELMPEYLAAYRATGLLPQSGFHHAVHVNDRIIPAVHRGEVRARPAFERFLPDGTVVFADGSQDRYDTVVLCLGYEMPDYSFIDGFDRRDLYEHHFYRRDPTLVVVNTPVDTEAFGTACPYFEAIGGWALAVLSGKVRLPGPEAMAAWCVEHMARLSDRRHFDCWLETIRIGLLSGALPDPEASFTEYWNIVSSVVTPANLRTAGTTAQPAEYDALVNLEALRHRILAALPATARDRLHELGQITADDRAAADAVPADRAIAPWLPYRQRA